MIKTCEICGETFHTDSYQQIYCSDYCRNAGKLENHKYYCLDFPERYHKGYGAESYKRSLSRYARKLGLRWAGDSYD